MTQAAQVKILYVGAKSGTSLQRAEALRRIGHDVFHVSPYESLPRYWRPWLGRLGGPGVDWLVARSLRRQILARRFDLVHVDSGDVIGRRSLAALRTAGPVVSNYNPDNPYEDPPPERLRWTLFRTVAAQYDLNVAPKRLDNARQMAAFGARRILTVWFAADEIAHRRLAAAEVAPKWASEVVFVGTWMPGRDAFLKALVERNISVAIYGPRWSNGPHYEFLRPYLKGDYLSGVDYSYAIAGAKVAIVLLNGENRDLHTTRSLEIPAIGTVMCAPRTAHHEELYVDGEEAILFDTVDDCADKCLRLLRDDSLRQRVAAAGHQRTFRNGTYNEVIMRKIVDAALGASPSAVAEVRR